MTGKTAWVAGICLAGSLAACESAPVPAAAPPRGLIPAGVVLTVPDMAASAARYAEQAVTVTGFDAGRQGLCKGAPPVSRSDWQLQGGGHCLYVHGPRPESRAAGGESPRLVRVKGIVRLGRDGAYYLHVPSTP